MSPNDLLKDNKRRNNLFQKKKQQLKNCNQTGLLTLNIAFSILFTHTKKKILLVKVIIVYSSCIHKLGLNMAGKLLVIFINLVKNIQNLLFYGKNREVLKIIFLTKKSLQ